MPPHPFLPMPASAQDQAQALAPASAPASNDAWISTRFDPPFGTPDSPIEMRNTPAFASRRDDLFGSADRWAEDNRRLWPDGGDYAWF